MRDLVFAEFSELPNQPTIVGLAGKLSDQSLECCDNFVLRLGRSRERTRQRGCLRLLDRYGFVIYGGFPRRHSLDLLPGAGQLSLCSIERPGGESLELRR